VFSKTFTALLACFVLTASMGWAVCSNATLTGNYGFLTTGTDSSGTPEALVGLITADGKGKWAGIETESLDGTIFANVPVTGTYSIASSCRGKGTFTPSGGTVSHYSFAISPTSKQVDIIETDSGFTVEGYALPLGTETCTNAGVKGTLDLTGSGTVVGVGPLAVAAQETLNGTGKLTGSGSRSIAGTISSGVAFSGTYQVSSNCTLSSSFTFSGQQINLSGVIVKGGTTILEIETDANTVVTSISQR
jgi:hypothetical protein